jgi:fluoroquinolone transport system permease protein
MKPLYQSFKQFIRQIISDSMLVLVCIAPILCGMVFKFVVPYLIDLFYITPLITSYYLLFDLLLCVLTPYMFCFASSMIILGEIDDNICEYLYVTPIGKGGYLVSRLGLPAILSTIASIIIIHIFSLSNIGLLKIILLSIFSSMLSIIGSMIIVSIASNKVEGMALAKLSSLIIMGIFVPFFLPINLHWLFFIMPSFWIAAFALEATLVNALMTFLTSSLLLLLLYKRFIKKIE